MLKYNVCPLCGGHPLHYSSRRGLKVFFMKLLGFRYYRCLRCNELFLGRNGIDGVKPPRRHRHSRQSR